MPYHIKIDAWFSFCEKRSHTIHDVVASNYKVLPNLQGVYIFHRGELNSLWSYPDNIFYIGAASRQSLRERAKRHSPALLGENADAKRMYKARQSVNGDLSKIRVSYYAFENVVPDYYPFLLEGYLLKKYEDNFGRLPEVNTGRR